MIARAAYKYLHINRQPRFREKYVWNCPDILQDHLRDHTGCNGILGIVTGKNRTEQDQLWLKSRRDRIDPVKSPGIFETVQRRFTKVLCQCYA